MTQEEKQLLLKDLCPRLSYGVRCKLDLAGYMAWNEEYAEKFRKAEKVRDNLFQVVNEKVYTLYGFPTPDRVTLLEFEGDENFGIPVEFIKPYLRPMDSMTEKEQRYIWDKYGPSFLVADFEDAGDVSELFNYCQMNISRAPSFVDWLNEHHFDYSGLIEKGLALEALENMYKTE